MITTEHLGADTLLIHAEGPVDRDLVKEVSFLVFRSFRLGVTTFYLNLNQITHIDESGLSSLALIAQGLFKKGGAWTILRPPSSVWDRLVLRLALRPQPPEIWN
jgi:ABC-type transporter Mla MlaB component